jgi:hypothetical protein
VHEVAHSGINVRLWWIGLKCLVVRVVEWCIVGDIVIVVAEIVDLFGFLIPFCQWAILVRVPPVPTHDTWLWLMGTDCLHASFD